eukprot:11441212-Heterocapsa_arctica.AAC.1
MRSQMWRISMRSAGNSWASGPSERGKVVGRGETSARTRVQLPSAAGFQLLALAALRPKPSMKMLSACSTAPG